MLTIGEPTPPKRRVNKLAPHSGIYLNTSTFTQQHITDNDNHLPIEPSEYQFKAQATPPDKMSNNTDLNNNSSHGSRDGRGARA